MVAQLLAGKKTKCRNAASKQRPHHGKQRASLQALHFKDLSQDLLLLTLHFAKLLKKHGVQETLALQHERLDRGIFFHRGRLSVRRRRRWPLCGGETKRNRSLLLRLGIPKCLRKQRRPP